MKKIIISNLCGMGDLIRMEPIVRGVKQKYPDSYLALLVREGREAVFEKCPFVDDLFVFPARQCNECLARGVPGMTVIRDVFYTFVACLRDMEFDIAIMPPLQVDATMSGLINPREYYGVRSLVWNDEEISGAGAQHFFDVMAQPPRYPFTGRTEHFVDLMYDICRELDLPLLPEERTLRFYLADRDRQDAVLFRAQEGIGEKPYVVMQVCSQGEERRWPLERFAAVAAACIDQYGFPVVVGGTHKERQEILDPFCRMVAREGMVFAVTGTLHQYAALIEQARLFISNDSGPLHIADAFSVPIVALFGGSNPAEAGPLSPLNEILFKEKMTDITVPEVMQAVAQLLDASAR